MDFGSIVGSTAKGAKAGAAAGPEGAVVGAGLGLATSLIQNIKADKLKRAADNGVPDLVDPNQAAYLAELNQKRKSMDTGADYAAGMDSVDSTTAGTNDAILKATGGDTGGTIQALLQANSSAGNAKNNIIASGQQQRSAYDQMYGGMLNQIAARKMQIQMYQSQQNMAEWAKMKQGANANGMAGAAGAASVAGGESSGGGEAATGGGGISDILKKFTGSGNKFGESASSLTPTQTNLSGEAGNVDMAEAGGLI